MQFKIVDSFNGYEDQRRFKTIEQAEQALEIDMQNFFTDNPGLTHFSFRKEIVQANAEWFYNCQENRFVWE